ncbi:MAG: YfiR family protein [Candidatus Korobacteraceae bacterium]
MQQPVHHAICRAPRRRTITLRLGAWLTCLLLLSSLLNARGPAAPETKPTEFEVEAAYLFEFGKFVGWPGTQTDASFVICVLGEDPFGSVLDRTIAGETLRGRPVQDKRIARPQDATACSILYISSSESARLSKILSVIQEAPVLTVSDIPEFVQQGGMIQFVLREGRVRFEVNLAPARRNGLAMSSELLKVAVEVVRGRGSD